MKNKIISFFSSIFLSLMLITPIIASATIIYNNPNGIVGIDMSDAVLITQYLNSGIDAANLERLDFDNNCFVSMADSYKVQLYNLGLMNYGTINLPSAVTFNGSTSETYWVFDAQTGVQDTTKSYTLSNTTTIINNLIEPEYPDVVIDDEYDREEDWSMTGVVKILNNESTASGFVVDSHTIATAAHCVYNYNDHYNISCFSSNSIKIFNPNGTCVLTATPVECHIPYSYINSIQTNYFQNNFNQVTNEYDYALVTVAEDLSNYKCFELGVALDSAITNELEVMCAGFPGIVNGVTVNDMTEHHMYVGPGQLYYSPNSFDPDRQLYFTNDATPGNSGGPIYIQEDVYDKNGNNARTYYSVLAIYAGDCNDFNIGTRINGELIRFYKGNQNIHWQLPT